ncbi:MAG: hypothetical protein H6559_33225 [Lewinellaceae bacterium]|nr:hypothetical protein [Lewinellaceae bacterium]
MITQKTATVKDWRTIAGGEPAAETGDIRYKGATIQQRTGNAVENGSAVAPSLPEKKQSFRMLPDDPLYRAPPNWAKFSVKLQLLRIAEELLWMTIAPPFCATFRMKEQLVITG